MACGAHLTDCHRGRGNREPGFASRARHLVSSPLANCIFISILLGFPPSKFCLTPLNPMRGNFLIGLRRNDLRFSPETDRYPFAPPDLEEVDILFAAVSPVEEISSAPEALRTADALRAHSELSQ